MKEIRLENQYYRYTLLLDEEGRLFHGCFLPSDMAEQVNPEEQAKRSPLPLEAIVNVDDEPLQLSHGVRYFYPRCSVRARFREITRQPLEQDGERTIITLLDEEKQLLIRLYYEVYPDSPALRRWTVLENAGEKPVEAVHVASYVLSNFPYFADDCRSTYLHAFTSHWSFEAQPWTKSFAELGIYDHGCRNGFAVESTGTWVCQQYIPYFVVEQRRAGTFTAVQLEYSSSWRFEAGAFDLGVDRWYYLQGGMGNHLHAQWRKKLSPGEAFRAPAASLTVAQGEISDVFDRMRLHQQTRLIKHSAADTALPVIYNDWPYMKADVTEEKILEQLDALRECGVDYYVTDSGWFTEPAGRGGVSSWWDRVGHWEPDPERFPHGLAYVVDRIREKGMHAGIWCEIEAVGRDSALYHQPSLLLQRDGRPVEDANRRFLSFLSPEGRAYADAVFARIVGWGFEYIKIDYNIDSAPGCTTETETSPGQGLHANRMAYYDWLDGIRRRYPGLIIENCASGGMRLDYGMLSRTDMASITDQGDYRLIGGVLFNVSKLISPDQCGAWSWLEENFDEDTCAFALSNSMAGRMHISGDLLRCGENKRALVRQAVELYKRYRRILPSSAVYHHTPGVIYHENDRLRIWEVTARSQDQAVIVAQRPDAPETEAVIYPRGLRREDQYTVTVFPDGLTRSLSGEELMGKGLRAEFPHPFTAKVFFVDKEHRT